MTRCPTSDSTDGDHVSRRERLGDETDHWMTSDVTDHWMTGGQSLLGDVTDGQSADRRRHTGWRILAPTSRTPTSVTTDISLMIRSVQGPWGRVQS